MSDDHSSQVVVAAVSADGLLGATATRPGEIRLWDLATGALRARAEAPSWQGVDGAAFLGPVLVTTSDYGGLLSWTHDLTEAGDQGDWRKLGPSDRLRSCSEEDSATAVHAAGQGIVVDVSAAGAVRGWRVENQIPGVSPDNWRDPVWSHQDGPLDHRLTSVCDHSRFVVVPGPSGLAVLDVGTGSVLRTIPVVPTALAAFPDLPLIVAARGGEIECWDVLARECQWRVQAHEDVIRGLAVAADRVLSTSRDGTAALWGWDGEPLGRFSPDTTNDDSAEWRLDPRGLGPAAGAPDGHRWLVGGAGGQVHVLDEALRPVRLGQAGVQERQLDVDALTEAIRAGGEVCVAAAGALTGLDVRAELEGDEHPSGTAKHLAQELATAGRKDDPAVENAVVVALATLDAKAATALYEELRPRRPDLPVTLLRLFTGIDTWTVPDLVERLPHVDHFADGLVTDALADRGDVALQAFRAALHEFPPGWEEISRERLKSAAWRLEPDTRDGLLRLLASTSPRARNTGMDAFSAMHRMSRHGPIPEMYESDVTAQAVHDCAVRELAAEEPGYGESDNRYQAMYALWFCYQPGDAPLIARVLAATDDRNLIDVGLGLVHNVFDADPDFDDGLLDTLFRIASDPEQDERIRVDAVGSLSSSARDEVVSFLLATLNDSNHALAVAAASTLLYRDHALYAERIAPLVDGWDDGAWPVKELRNKLEDPDW